MHSISISGGTGAPLSSQDQQAARVGRRVNVSSSLAGVIAGLAWGSERRDDDTLLVAVTTSRCSTAAVEAR